MKKPVSVDDYIAQQGKWKEMLETLREILLSTGMDEKIKWVMPCYMDRSKNISSIFATKDFVGLWFFQGALLSDSSHLLSNAQKGKTKMMRRMIFKIKEDIDHKQIEEYLYEAIENERLGRQIKPVKSKSISFTIPKELEFVFKSNPELRAHFMSFPVGKKRDYTEYIGEAKKEETRKRRLEKCIPMIQSGLGLNDKYRK
ncbi:MAG: YdeI/OmpD-associated family protein [Saprospiraceae bacterium]